MTEEWRVCPSHPTMMASSLGRVRHVTSNDVRRPYFDGRYQYVGLWHQGKLVCRTVHSLVCDAFHGGRPDGTQIRHLDGDSRNNCPDNLAYGTALENAADREAHMNTRRGQDNGNAKIPDLAAKVIRASYEAKVGTQYELAALFGISQAQVFNIVHGRQRVRPASPRKQEASQ